MNLFDPKDYQSISIHVSAKNLTSGLDIVIPAVKNNKEPQVTSTGIQLMEFREKGTAVFGLPKNSCAVGHNLALLLVIKEYKSELRMSLTAKVVSVENDQNPYSTVNLQFVQYAQDEWDRFIEVYSRRQAEILKFLSDVRGES